MDICKQKTIQTYNNYSAYPNQTPTLLNIALLRVNLSNFGWLHSKKCNDRKQLMLLKELNLILKYYRKEGYLC